MAKFKIKTITAGFGVTILPKEQGGNVLKYYFEPQIELEVPAEGDADQMTETLDQLAEDVLSKIQAAVKKKALSDKQKSEQKKLEAQA